VDPEQISFDDTPIEETDNEVEMEKRRQADLQKFCSKVFTKLIFDATFAKIEHKERRDVIVAEMVQLVLRETNTVINDNERIKQEKLRWVMNQSEDTRLRLEMELEEKRIREEHERALS